ncbi:unnamed protein product [Boreogadus saida]
MFFSTGYHFVKDCTERMITKCSRCPEGTFQAGRNILKQCSTCTKCDAGLGLKVKKSCSSTSDAVCEVLDGFFCSDSNRGTAVKDTECLHCTDGTFSDGTRLSCKNHTNPLRVSSFVVVGPLNGSSFLSGLLGGPGQLSAPPGQPPERLCTSVGPVRRPPWDLLLPGGGRPVGTLGMDLGSLLAMAAPGLQLKGLSGALKPGGVV